MIVYIITQQACINQIRMSKVMTKPVYAKIQRIRTTKTQISLGIHTVWSASLLFPRQYNTYICYIQNFKLTQLVSISEQTIWAASSEFVSSSIPSWQILTAHAQPFRGARDLAFCLKVPLDSLLVWASSEGSGETARMCRLAWTFAARIGYKYQIRLTRSIWSLNLLANLCRH